MTAQISELADLPEKVEQTIKERVDRVTQFSKTLAEILECASVEGDDFIAQVIAKVKERGGKSLANGSRIHEFAFKHNLIREYVYQHLPKTKRELLHVKIGDCLERLYAPNADEIAAQLAVHFYHGYVPEKAVVYGLKATQDANARYGAAEAVRFAKMGLEALETRKAALPPNEYAETKIRLLLELAKAEEDGGEPKEQKDHIQNGIEYLEGNLSLLTDLSGSLYAEVYSQIGRLYSKKGGKQENAKFYFEKALEVYEAMNDKKHIAEILYQLGDIYPHILAAEKDKGFQSLEKSLLIAEEISDTGLQSKALSKMAWQSREKGFLYAEKCALRSLELSKSDKYAMIEACIAMAVIHRGHAKYQSAIHYLEESLEIARQIGATLDEASILNDLGSDYSRYIHLQKEAQDVLQKSISIKERFGSQKVATLFLTGNLFKIIGYWGKVEEYYQKILEDCSEFVRSQVQFTIGKLETLREEYIEAESKLLNLLRARERFYKPKNLHEHLAIALNYALSGKVVECREFLKIILNLFQQEHPPTDRAMYLYSLAEIYRILQEEESAKSACKESLDWFLANAEDAENLLVVAEARLIMGKILVDMEEHQDAIEYLEKARTAFDICQHYAFGETLLYLGKAHVGLGGVILRRQGKEYVTQALAEFERLDLAHKASEARDMLKTLP